MKTSSKLMDIHLKLQRKAILSSFQDYPSWKWRGNKKENRWNSWGMSRSLVRYECGIVGKQTGVKLEVCDDLFDHKKRKSNVCLLVGVFL